MKYKYLSVVTKLNKKQIRKNRWWKHMLNFLPIKIFGPDLKEITNYNPEAWREAFEQFQSHGKTRLTQEEIYYIHPLIDAQKNKEITLTSLCGESFEWWAKGWGWIYPFSATFKTLNRPIDRIFLVALLKIVKAIKKDPISFYSSHPGISSQTKYKFFGLKN